MLIAVNTRFLLKDKLEGIGWFTYETMKRITQSHPEHTFLFLFDRQWDPEFIFSDNIIPLKVWPPARHPWLWKYWFDHALPKIFKKYKPDVFISTDGFLSLYSNIPTVLVIHDLGFEEYPEHTPKIASNYYRKFTPFYAKKATKIVTVSKFSREDIIKRYKIDPLKISVLYNGANEAYKPVNTFTKNIVRQSYTNGEEYFLYVGSIHPRKNLKNLLLAYDKFKRETGVKIKLLIVGRFWWKNSEVSEIYNNMKFKHDVIFAGHMQVEELATVTASAEALIFPSLFEGFGIPVIEARYCNITVICSNRTSLPEIAGENALFFDPENVEDLKNVMQYFFLNRDLSKKNSNDSLVARKQFNWDFSAKKLYSLAEEVAEVNRNYK